MILEWVKTPACNFIDDQKVWMEEKGLLGMFIN